MPQSVPIFPPLSWNSTGPIPTRTRTPTLGMRLSCNFVNVYTIAYRVQYTFTHVHARILYGHPREDPRVKKRACQISRRTSRRGSSCVSGSLQAERGSRRTRRHPRDDPRVEVGEDVRVGIGVGVRVGAVECQLYETISCFIKLWRFLTSRCSRVPVQDVTLSGNNLRQVIHTRIHQAV